MGLRYYYRDNDGNIQEAQARVRRMTLAASASAEEGSVGTFELTVDDPDADFDIRGHRRFYIVEDAALGDPYAGVVWSGYTGDRDVIRGPFRNGSERQWILHLHDVNTLLDRRINVGNDCNRPAETDLERIDWLMGTTELGSLIESSTTYIDSTGAVDMDAVDYRGQKVIDVIDDCAQQSGRNYFLFWLGGADDFYLWYKHSASSNYTSSYRISNDLADVNSTTIFAPDQETKLTRSPSRVYSGVYQQFDGGAVYETSPTTAERFARRDTIGRGENVKTRASATFRARRYLADIDTELDTIATSIITDGGKINGLMQGHRVLVKYTHLPGYSDDYKPMRVRDRTVHEIAPDVYEIAMNLTGPSLESLGGSGAPPIYDSTIFARLLNASGPYPLPSGDLYWDTNSDLGLPWEATVGPFTFLTSGVSWPPYRSIQVDDDGTLQSVTLIASAIGVPTAENEPYTVTWDLMLNDTSIASEALVVYADGASGPTWGSWGPSVVANDVAVSNGDILWGRLSCLPVPMEMFRSPLGVNPGINGNRLEIKGGAF